MNQVKIFDTTLRDGEQSPGASMNLKEKLVIAHSLADLGVDIIEAGFPIASDGDFAAVSEVAKRVKGPVIAGLARCHPADIERAFQALQHSKKPRLHVFLASSPIHRKFKLRMNKQEVLDRTFEGVSKARSLCPDVEFSAEDGSRTEWDFLVQVVAAALEAGATTINIPDTVGYAMPAPFSQLISHLRNLVPGLEGATLSVHCHNDLGMAVANSLAAVEAGARQVECTINGIGERAGNCSLEEVVMALKTRHDIFQLETRIHTEHLYPASRLVSGITGLPVQRNKAIVGENAFAHEAGIHQHGVLQHATTYEIMKPEDVGVNGNKLVLGKHSGRHAFKDWMDRNGYLMEDEEFELVFTEFKVLADRKKNVYEEDLIALMEQGLSKQPGPWTMISLHTSAGVGKMQTATVSMAFHGEKTFQEAACGSGPVEALFNAIERVVGISVHLKHYDLKSVTRGKDAQGEANVEIEHEGKTYHGRGFSTDIFEASAKAFLNVLNRLAEMPKEALSAIES